MNSLGISITELILKTAVERFVYNPDTAPQAIVSTLALAGDAAASESVPDDEAWQPKPAYMSWSGTRLADAIENEISELQFFVENLLGLCIYDVCLLPSDSEREFWFSIRALDPIHAQLWGKEKAERMRIGNEFYTLTVRQRGELVCDEIFI